jgi:hypothetical protein
MNLSAELAFLIVMGDIQHAGDAKNRRNVENVSEKNFGWREGKILEHRIKDVWKLPLRQINSTVDETIVEILRLTRTAMGSARQHNDEIRNQIHDALRN